MHLWDFQEARKKKVSDLLPVTNAKPFICCTYDTIRMQKKETKKKIMQKKPNKQFYPFWKQEHWTGILVVSDPGKVCFIFFVCFPEKNKKVSFNVIYLSLLFDSLVIRREFSSLVRQNIMWKPNDATPKASLGYLMEDMIYVCYRSIYSRESFQISKNKILFSGKQKCNDRLLVLGGWCLNSWSYEDSLLLYWGHNICLWWK